MSASPVTVRKLRNLFHSKMGGNPGAAFFEAQRRFPDFKASDATAEGRWAMLGELMLKARNAEWSTDAGVFGEHLERAVAIRCSVHDVANAIMSGVTDIGDIETIVKVRSLDEVFTVTDGDFGATAFRMATTSDLDGMSIRMGVLVSKIGAGRVIEMLDKGSVTFDGITWSAS